MQQTGKSETPVERVVELAMRLGGKHLADYGLARSRHDFTQRRLMAKASAATLPAKLYADADYDAEWGAESVIKPARQRADGTRSGFWRSWMSEKYLARKGYGRRWAVERFFSGLKRTMGSTLTSRKPNQLLAEAAFKVLAYTLRR